MATISEKILKLESLISGFENVIVGFSGGVDSTLAAYVSNKILGNRAIIALAVTETITVEDIELARAIARRYDFNLREIKYNELDIGNYRENPVNRCYFCKQELYRQLEKTAREENIKVVMDGANLDDLGDYRPGRAAAKEFGVRSPLIEAGMNKREVREAAQFYGLPNYDKPSAPCLSSRIPYGTVIDLESLKMIAQGERFIRDQGFRNVRVRHFQKTAKIEVDAEDINRLFGMFDEVLEYFKKVGYLEVIIDPEGFASGKLNRGIVKNAG